MADVGKALKKLKSHPIHTTKSIPELEKLATELTTPEIVRKKFAHLLEAGQDMVWDIAEENDDDLLHTMEFEAHHERIKHETSRACNLPVKLSLQKLRNIPRRTLPLAHSFAALLKFEYGPLHAAVIVGNVLIEWGREGMVEPQIYDHQVSEFQANVSSLGEWPERSRAFQVEMSLADRQRNTERKLDTLCKSMEEKAALIDKLVDVIVDYNRNKEYAVFKCNCQDFVRDALAALEIKKPVEFSGRLQERFKQFKAGKIKEEAELKTHENLDAYVEGLKDDLSRQDLEYLQCLYFGFHLPAIEKSANPEAWVCEIPTCKSAELDTLIREHQLKSSSTGSTTSKRESPTFNARRNSTDGVPGGNGRRRQSSSSQTGSPQLHSDILQSSSLPQYTLCNDHKQPCINECGCMGDRDKAGLCTTCFELERRAASDKENQIVTAISAVPQELRVVKTIPTTPDISDDTLIKCFTPGCEFYGTLQSNLYCSKCFDPSKAPKCDVCQKNVGSLEYMGLCHDCFVKKTETESYLLAKQHDNEQTDAPKCLECRTFFANEEYNGLCDGCFKFKTTLDTPAGVDYADQHAPIPPMPSPIQARPNAKKVHVPGYERCLSRGCKNPRTETGYCDICNFNARISQPPSISTHSYTQSECSLCNTGLALTEHGNLVCEAHKRELVEKSQRQFEPHAGQTQSWVSESGYTPTRKPVTTHYESTTPHQQHETPHLFCTETQASPASVWTEHRSPHMQRGSHAGESVVCVIPRCQYIGYEELDYLCPSCYEKAHPGRRVPDTLPLV